MLEVKVSQSTTGAVVYLNGIAEASTADQLLRSLGAVLQARPSSVLVMLDGLQFIDSCGLGALVGASRRARAQQCPFVVMTTDPQIQHVMKVTGLNKMLAVCVSESEAVQAGASLASGNL